MTPLPYILDTDILVHLTRDDETGKEIKARYDPLMSEITPALCVVTDGEIRSLAYQFSWGEDKRARMMFLLSYFRRFPVEPTDVLEAYAVMDAHSKRSGIRMGKNDVWIAATAHVSGFTLLTTDHDFDHLAPDFLEIEVVEFRGREGSGDLTPNT
jgi:tRNA(fMet)-specific endonuclease VapC